tara:strand:+ start:844 stop:1143 length:300 start_codon:yes stop_codon:yes gene_type:complete
MHLVTTSIRRYWSRPLIIQKKAKSFNGTIHFIFHPANEGGVGAKVMMDDGLFEKFSCDAIYRLHNMPGIEAGHIGLRAGPIMATSDEFKITFRGKGGQG